MPTKEDLARDLSEILGSGISHTATVMELLKNRGWTTDQIVPIIYHLLLIGKVDPNGTKTPYNRN